MKAIGNANLYCPDTWRACLAQRSAYTPERSGSLWHLMPSEIEALCLMSDWREDLDQTNAIPGTRVYYTTSLGGQGHSGMVGVVSLENLRPDHVLRLQSKNPSDPEADCSLTVSGTHSPRIGHVFDKTARIVIGDHEGIQVPWTLIAGPLTPAPSSGKVPAAMHGRVVTRGEAEQLGFQWAKMDLLQGTPYAKRYIGCHVVIDASHPALSSKYVTDTEAAKRLARDGERYHVTLVTPPELNALVKDLKKTHNLQRDQAIRTVMAQFVGLSGDADDVLLEGGAPFRGEHKGGAYVAIAAKCREADQIRESMGLPKIQMHVTIGVS